MRIHFLLRFSCDARRYPDSQNTSGIPDGVHAEPVRQTVASGKAIEEREDASLYKENFRPFFPTRKLRELFLNSRPALIVLECAMVFEDPNGSTLL